MTTILIFRQKHPNTLLYLPSFRRGQNKKIPTKCKANDIFKRSNVDNFIGGDNDRPRN